MLLTGLVFVYAVLAIVMWKVYKSSHKPVTEVLQMLCLSAAFAIAIGKITDTPGLCLVWPIIPISMLVNMRFFDK